MSKALTALERRTFRTRNKLKAVNTKKAGMRETRPRLSVHRSNKAIYAQIIDDIKGVTVAAASSLDADLNLKTGSNVEAAAKVGKLIAERAKKVGISKVQFDRGGALYHGRIKALADGAREGGLDF